MSPSVTVRGLLSVGVALSLCLWVRVGGKPDCPPGTYHHPVTGTCTDCGGICEDAEIKKSEEECKFYCSDYGTECLPGFYFNVALNSCGSCTVLCSNTTEESECRQKCTAEHQTDNTKRLSAGMIVLIVFIVIVIIVLGLFGLAHLFRPGSRRPWRTRNPYRRPQTAPDEFDDPHTVFCSNDDIAALEDEQKDRMGFTGLNLTIQNPMT